MGGVLQPQKCVKTNTQPAATEHGGRSHGRAAVHSPPMKRGHVYSREGLVLPHREAGTALTPPLSSRGETPGPGWTAGWRGRGSAELWVPWNGSPMTGRASWSAGLCFLPATCLPGGACEVFLPVQHAPQVPALDSWEVWSFRVPLLRDRLDFPQAILSSPLNP